MISIRNVLFWSSFVAVGAATCFVVTYVDDSWTGLSKAALLTIVYFGFSVLTVRLMSMRKKEAPPVGWQSGRRTLITAVLVFSLIVTSDAFRRMNPPLVILVPMSMIALLSYRAWNRSYSWSSLLVVLGTMLLSLVLFAAVKYLS